MRRGVIGGTPGRRGQRGLSLIEVTLASALVAVVAIKVLGTLDAASENSTRDTAASELDAQASHVLRQIGFAIMGSHPETLVPDVDVPMTSTSVRYQVSLGVEDGYPVLAEPEVIALDAGGEEIYWTDEPDLEDQRRVVWTRLVAPFLEGEIPNGIDDNGNGLVDESGLAFAIEGINVEIHLTLTRVLNDGTVLRRTLTKTVACRNLINGWTGSEE